MEKLKRFLLSLVLMVAGTSFVCAQSEITGTVVDVTGEPIIGATVMEKGTSNGTITDFDGNFKLKVEPGTILVFSYVGFEKQEVAAAPGMQVTMKDNTAELNEVVVTGYQTQRKADLTGAISVVNTSELAKQNENNPIKAMQGRVPGMNISADGNPSGAATVRIRGNGTLNNNDPLYIIDGVPTKAGMHELNGNDIESIQVLKDAASASIYGSRAANGVIIITTKSGGKTERTNVSYNGYVGFDIISKKLDIASADDIRGYVRANNLDYAYDKGGNTDWQKEVLRTGISHNHNVSITGGSAKTKYMASVNYMNRQGVIDGTKMNRVNIRSLISSKILKDRLDVSIGVNAMYGKHVGVPMGDTGASVLDAMNYFNPTLNTQNPDGTWTTGDGSANYNPLSMINEDTSETMWKRNQIIAKGTLHIIEGLDWNANYSFNHRQSTYSDYHSHNTQLVPYNAYNGNASRNTYFGDDQTFETYLNYDHTFAKVHKLALMAGYSWEERRSNDGFGLTVHNFFDDYLKWNQLTYAGTIDGMPAVQSGTKETIRNISFYGRLSYSFNSRYMLQATIRRDGSSVFGKDNRWGTFPSVSAAWNITEEPFMANQNVFDNLKLRFGYGVSGNALGFGAYSAVATYGATGSTFTYNGNQWAILGATKLANPDLKWETTGMFNIGIDYGFWNNRINGSIEFYHKKTKDLIWNYPVSTVIYPFDNIAANVGEITNKGIEFTINIDAIRTKDFNWMTTLNLSHNSNKVNKLSNDKFEVGYFTQGDPMVAGVSANGYTQRIMEGEPLGTFYLHAFAGYNAEGKATYYVFDENGNQTSETTSTPDDRRDRYVAGNAQPKLNLGWNNTLNYKNWNMTLFFTGVFGNKIYNGSRAHYTAPDFFAGGKNVLKEFITDRAVADNLSNIPSDRFLEKGDYFRLQTLSIGYTFDKLGDWLQSLQLYATCNNVFTITGYKGLDPEVNMGGISPGVDYRWSNYPHTRTIMVGTKINF